jgi:heme/copper-type cytochrome/quinol oxidase subunit 1
MTIVAEPRHSLLRRASDAIDLRMRRTRSARGVKLYDWICATDSASIGLRTIVTAIVFLFLGGSLALLMRLQLAQPDGRLIGPDLYNQVFSTHGTTMMFLFGVPVMQGLGLYFVPLMVGAKDLAFPRLAAFSYWLYLFGGALLFVSLLTNTGPDAGWFSYAPLSGPE